MNDEEKIPAKDAVAAEEIKNERISSQPPMAGIDPLPSTIAPEPLTDNPQPETLEDMEVHHHTHAGHGKKKWKDYFWEFLMLFLAVFCGFLAEYQLEHVIEHQREKEFIKSMVEDLETDHQQLNGYSKGLKLGLQQMDSLVTLLGDEKAIRENGNLIYYFGRVSPRLLIFTNSNRTFDQLKNSGGFRLIRNAKASGKIMGYYGSVQFIRHLEGLYFEEFAEYKKIASRIYEPAVFRGMELPDGNISRNANNPVLQTNDPQQLKQLALFAIYMNGSRRSLIPAADSLQKSGDELIAYLKKSYHLDN